MPFLSPQVCSAILSRTLTTNTGMKPKQVKAMKMRRSLSKKGAKLVQSEPHERHRIATFTLVKCTNLWFKSFKKTCVWRMLIILANFPWLKSDISKFEYDYLINWAFRLLNLSTWASDHIDLYHHGRLTILPRLYFWKVDIWGHEFSSLSWVEVPHYAPVAR